MLEWGDMNEGGSGGNARGQENRDGKEQNLSFHYFVSPWQHATPPVGEGTGNGPA